MDTIYIVNYSTVVPDNTVASWIPALQQNANDFASVWGIQATIEFAPHPIAPTLWQLALYDHTDTPGAGGYHFDEKGRIGGKVFVGDAMEMGLTPTVDISHEMLEMMGDPMTTTLVLVKSLGADRYYWLQEVCDPCEDDIYAYNISGVRVSDFVTPAYVNGNHDKLDFCGHLTMPCPALLSGGYLTLWDSQAHQYVQQNSFYADGTMSARSRRHGRSAHRATKPPKLP